MLYDDFYVKSLIRSVEDWPKPGINFRDITPIFSDPKGMRMVADAYVHRYIASDITHIACIDARGFLIAAVLAYELQKPLILIRKKGKLPGKTISQAYDLEYGSAELEIQENSVKAGDNVLLFDDLIATGGTLLAAIELLTSQGAEVKEVAAIIDLPDLGGSQKLQDRNIPVFNLCAYEGD
ncbi:Adenine phosphoribosyltransferase [Marinomonas spartinae]|uniref:Adenine phosphoribosyltransferase n=1 Tax=Marinomonas spartinae TaxID=1792290 RepID=A0A1A8TMT1_9GAMM|nr:adenine phosphoribosyltransferase [Marinomonas spartinae]SBS33924.1 Adenine phosphoribosyltransferase [Marinomonas spartinae]SBS37978.1 Adenine phosphoribosyltransferase [Marinomonas spartinae]